MPAPGSPTPSSRLPQEWRIPPWQPAALLLAVSAFAALDIYGSPSTTILIVTAFLALTFMVGAVLAMRYLLVADEEGIWVRGLLGENCVRWDELRDVDVLHTKRGASTVRIYRQDSTYLDVPPALLQPTLPTKIEKARAVVQGVAAQLEQLAAARDR
ncbi:MAG: PH domain-containing protein [Actinomycetota bacterium]|nr:PH domain-containing protein [Actinomycetota bacterium]